MATKQDKRDSYKNMNRNPTGKGGFAEHPENRSDGGWKKENTISYQYKRFLNMTPEELEEWVKTTPKSERTVAMDVAYNQIIQARNSLAHVKEITDRTEGRAPETISMELSGSLSVGEPDPEKAQDYADYLKRKTKGVKK